MLTDNISLPPCCVPDDIHHLMAAARTVVDETPPPTLRDILTAYRSKGDGDRDMLLAMLNAKAAEDQRLASVASLQRTILDVYNTSASSPQLNYRQLTPPSPPPSSLPQPHMNPNHHYPSRTLTQSPHPSDKKSRRSHHHLYPQPYHHHQHSPPHPRHHPSLPPPRDPPPSHSDHFPRKRHRSSKYYDSHYVPSHDQFPPSPYSSSGRSDSADYSPRTRPSMAIGSLLTSGPSNVNGDDP